jgi:hypothetical protein
VVSTALLSGINDAGVFPGKLLSQFDHKPVYLKINCQKKVAAEGLKNWFLHDKTIKISTEIAALQVYAMHINFDTNQQLQVTLRNAIDAMTANICQIFKVREEISKNYDGSNDFNQHLIAAKYGEHGLLMADLPDWNTLNNFPKLCDDKKFFMDLTTHISSRVAGTQKKLNKLKNFFKKLLMEEINKLELDYDRNRDRISTCEKKLNEILNMELRRLISNKKFSKI